MKKTLALSTFVALCLFAIPRLVFGEDPIPEVPFGQWFSDIVQAFMQFDYKALKGWPLAAGLIALVVRFVISSMKVSILRQWIWDKLPGWAKYCIAPVLTLVIVLVSVQFPSPVTFMSVLKAIGFGLFSGAGAIALHSLLCYIESLPGINSVVKGIVGFLANLLGAKLPTDAKYIEVQK